jgi:2-oxoisovalerate dehydrogenase E1 component alpha subunit
MRKTTTLAPKSKRPLKSSAKIPAKMPAKAAGTRQSVTIHSKATLPRELQLGIYDLMIKSRVLEERLIKVYKTGDAFFWIGGAGEEAFGVPLGLLIHKGQGPEYDYLHLHYRATPTMIALGMPIIDSLRLMMNRVTDPSTGGRNFCNHYCFPQWNVVPVTSPIEVQYGMAIGTAIAQRRRWYIEGGKTPPSGKKSISVISGGDAGTAEGDFASSLIWASRPGFELPMLITVQNNKWGISTSYDTQHGEKNIADRGKAFGIRTAVVNGNDPIETYLALQTEMEYIRKTGKPVLAEFHLSRIYGHSSATGANRETDVCPIELFEKKLIDQKWIKPSETKELWKRYDEESREVADQVRKEPVPTRESIWDNIYVGNENADWRKF